LNEKGIKEEELRKLIIKLRDESYDHFDIRNVKFDEVRTAFFIIIMFLGTYEKT
jgi:hypothetical protein